MFLAAFQTHPVERRSEGYFLTPGKRISKQVSTLGILILYRKHKLLRHLNSSQSCNGFRLYFGVSVRFNMILSTNFAINHNEATRRRCSNHLVEGNIFEIRACYSFSRIEPLKSENLFTYLNLNARRVTTAN